MVKKPLKSQNINNTKRYTSANGTRSPMGKIYTIFKVDDRVFQLISFKKSTQKIAF